MSKRFAKLRENSAQGIRPAVTDLGRERQLCNLAIDLAEQQLRDGTASPSVINHYLKLAAIREQEAAERLARKQELEEKLIEAKIQALNANERYEELTNKAIQAFRSYQGDSTDIDEEDDEDERK